MINNCPFCNSILKLGNGNFYYCSKEKDHYFNMISNHIDARDQLQEVITYNKYINNGKEIITASVFPDHATFYIRYAKDNDWVKTLKELNEHLTNEQVLRWIKVLSNNLCFI